MMKAMSRRFAIALFAVVIGFAMTMGEADARLGGGRSFGKQSGNVFKREAPAQQGVPAPRQNNATPAPVQPTPGAAPQPQPQRNRWLGPIAGLAAGLGIAALMSHFGFGGALGEMMGSMLLIFGLVIAGVFLFRLLRRSTSPQPSYAGVPARDAGPYRFDIQQPAPVPASTATGAPLSVTGVPLRPLGQADVDVPGNTTAGSATWAIPADFDVGAFVRTAKVYFVRLQAAWDAGDQADIREFTTPEMFAEIRLDITERGARETHTDVVELEADLLGIEEDGTTAMASVRFHGLIRESRDAQATPFAEVWNLAKSLSGKQGWLLAGIQQEPAGPTPVSAAA